MTALNDDLSSRQSREISEPTTRKYLRTRWFIAAVIALGGVQLMIQMDGTIRSSHFLRFRTSWACRMPRGAG